MAGGRSIKDELRAAEERIICEFVDNLENRVSGLERELINTGGSSQQAQRSDCPSSPTDLMSFQPCTPPRQAPLQQFDPMETPTMFDPFNPYASPPKPWTGQQMYVMDKLEEQRIKKERECQLLQEKEFGQEMDMSCSRHNLQDAIDIFDPVKVCPPETTQPHDNIYCPPAYVESYCPPADDVYSGSCVAGQPESSRVPPCPTTPRVPPCPASPDTGSPETYSSSSPQPRLSPEPYNDFPSGPLWGEDGPPTEWKLHYSHRDSPDLAQELLPPEALESVGGSNFLVEGMDDLPLFFNPLDAPRPGRPRCSRREDTQQLISRARQLTSKYKPQPSVNENCPPIPCPPILQRQTSPQIQSSPQRLSSPQRQRSEQRQPTPPVQLPKYPEASTPRAKPSGIAKVSGLKQPTTTASQKRCIPQLTPTAHTPKPGLAQSSGIPQTQTIPRSSGLPQSLSRAGTSGRTGIPGATHTLVAPSNSGARVTHSQETPACAGRGRGGIVGRGGRSARGGRERSFGRGTALDSTRGDPCYDFESDYGFLRPEAIADDTLQPRRLDQQAFLETVAQIIQDAQKRIENVRENLENC